MDENIKTVIEETKKYFDAKEAETMRHFDAKQAETVKRIDALQTETARQFDEVKDKIQIVFEQVVANTEDLAIVKSDLGTIKHELKQKVSYDEFAALEQRVIAIESKMAKVS